MKVRENSYGVKEISVKKENEIPAFKREECPLNFQQRYFIRLSQKGSFFADEVSIQGGKGVLGWKIARANIRGGEMDSDQLSRIGPNVFYRKYLFQSGNFRDWMNVWLNILNDFVLRRAKRYCVIWGVVFNLLFYTVAADGSGRELFIVKWIQTINQNIAAYEKAYEEIEQLASSLGTTAGLKDADESFLFAFLITKWSREFGFDPWEVAAVALTESQFNPRAVSSKDARGLMQIHAPTWSMDDYFNVEKNIKKAVQILYMYRNSQPGGYLKRYYGDTGEGGVQYTNKVKDNKQKLKDS